VPIYEYRCEDCGAVSEFLVQKVGATPADLRCAKCGGRKLTKALSTMAVHSQASGGASSCASGECPLSASSRSMCSGPNCPL